MGRRGPRPTPTPVKLRRGETRPSRVNYREPEPDPSEPRMPPGMDDVARATWRFVIRAMRGTGVIRKVDAHLLRIYCEAFSRYVEASRLLAAGYPTVRGRAPESVVRNPLHQVVRDNADLVRMFARELGVGPTVRAGLEAKVGGPWLADIGPPPRLRSVDGPVSVSGGGEGA